LAVAEFTFIPQTGSRSSAAGWSDGFADIQAFGSSGAKAHIDLYLYAALKRRSSTSLHAVDVHATLFLRWTILYIGFSLADGWASAFIIRRQQRIIP
jgi:hypothetical protein